MAKLVNWSNVKYIANILYNYLYYQIFLTKIVRVNEPKDPAIFALWHGNQFALCSLPNWKSINILVSNSIDGEIISQAIEKLGFSVIRGSSNRKGCISSTLQMISKLKSGESVAVMVDGPRGPLHSVKNGVVKLAKETGIPIIPMCWYSPEITFLQLPSWDKMTTPLLPCHILTLYGDPIYVKNEDDDKEIIDKVKNALLNLDEQIIDEYEKAKKQNLWKKKK